MKATRVNVTDAAAVAAWTPPQAHVNRPLSVVVKNAGTDSVFVGASDVTAAAGYELIANEIVSYSTVAVDTLYAICDTGGTATLHVLREGNN